MKMNFAKIQMDAIKKLEKKEDHNIALGVYQDSYGLTLDGFTLVFIPKCKWYLNETAVEGERGLMDVGRIVYAENSLVEIKKTNRRIADNAKIKDTLVVFENEGKELFVSEKRLAYFPKEGCVYKTRPGNQIGFVYIYEGKKLIGVVTVVPPKSL